jgi:hypothetical protein
MKIGMTSPRTGKLNVMDLPVTEDQLTRWRVGRELIQNVMPHLTSEQREFLLTGYTPEDWEILFPPEDDDV